MARGGFPNLNDGCRRGVLAEVVLPDLAATERFAAELERRLPAAACIGLIGTLGAGKTHLVRAIGTAAGIDREAITSPTFTLVQRYHGNRQLTHLDAYRVADEDEWWELGIEELWEEPGLILIEWADRFAETLPPEGLWVRLEHAGAGRRAQLWGDLDRWSKMSDGWTTPGAGGDG